MKYSKIIICIFITIAFNYALAYSQFINKYYISAGLTSFQIMGDNPAIHPIEERGVDIEDKVYGGSFKDAHPGFCISLLMDLDSNGIFTIPLNFEYTQLVGKSKVLWPNRIVYKVAHSVEVPTLSLGCNYNFVRLPFAYAKCFVGVEALASFITDSELDYTVEDWLKNKVENNKYKAKDACFRFGAGVRLGVDGQVFDNLYVNMNAGVKLLNINTDDSRGQLFTPAKNTPIYTEIKESSVWVFSTHLMIQYRI